MASQTFLSSASLLQFNPEEALQNALQDIDQSETNDRNEVEVDVFAEQEELDDMDMSMSGDQFACLQERKNNRLDDAEVEGVKNASKGVTENTAQAYIRLKNNFQEFLRGKGHIKEGEDFYKQDLKGDTPLLIVTWIMDKCDEIRLDGQKRDHTENRASYQHAQKMRAAMTYVFGKDLGLGSQPFHYDKFGGRWVGNPSICDEVGSYMVSLCRRKVRAGYVQTSARALDSDILRKMYDHNKSAKFANPAWKPNRQEGDGWGGLNLRTALQLGYTIAFTCCLRSDELIRMEWQHIQCGQDTDGRYMEITLPYRKTAQRGGIKPFRIYTLPISQAHLCPVRAYADWLYRFEICGREPEGFIFRRIYANDRIGADKGVAMTSEQFLECFRENLLDVKVDPISYGTHSFRRGGCQWLHTQRRWLLRRICDWAGWSMELTNLTIVKYLISWNDDPKEKREDFFNPNQRPVLKCFACGRQCHCN